MIDPLGNRLKIFFDNECTDEFLVDVESNAVSGGFCKVGVGHGETKKLAWLSTVQKLKTLLRYAEVKYKLESEKA